MTKKTFCLVPTYYLYKKDQTVLYMWYPADKMLYQLVFYIPEGIKTEPVFFGKLQIGTKEIPMPRLHRWNPCEGWSLGQIQQSIYGFSKIEVEVAQELFPSVELE